MARSILVPLDGSHLSEAALPHALLMARALGAGITLLHVVEKDAPQRVHGETHVGTVEEAEAYLARIQTRLEAEGVAAIRHVHPGPVSKVARSIAEHRLEIPYDMAVVCTHGGFGAGRALFGSVGQRVLADASVPVLVVRPGVGSPQLRVILVALAAQHASSLPLAAELAHASSARVHLLMVIPTFETRRGGMRLIGRYLPGATAEALDQETEGAGILLEERKRELQAAGLTVTTEVARGAPVAAILSAAQTLAPDLTVMATHGRRGLGAFWAGSVANDVCARCDRPVLLVPAQG